MTASCDVYSDNAMRGFMPSGETEMCTVWPQLMLTTPSRNSVSRRLKRGEREKCRFWPDNVVMIFFKMKQNALWQLNVSGNLTEPCTTSWGFHQISFNVYNLQFNISFSALCLLFTGSNFPPNCHLLQISRKVFA